MITALNTPSVPSYANYAVFSGVAAATNTGGTTVAVNSLSALTVYKDTVAGPVALSGGEIVAGNVLYLIYDSALNTGAGGFHLNSQQGSLIGITAQTSAPDLTVVSITLVVQNYQSLV